jgi:1-acyl-sn-glycerol-3-phosphate acyltransferase
MIVAPRKTIYNQRMKETRPFPRFAFWLDLLARCEVRGRENLPPQGPYIFVLNHLSKLDVPIAYSVVGKYPVNGWAASKWENHILFGNLLKWGEAIFIRRGEVDREAIAAAVAWLQSGKIFGVAPEGTRSLTGELMRGKTGAAYLANEARVPVVPLAIYGTETVSRSWLRLRRAPITISIGPPVHLPPFNETDRAASLRQNTDEIMCHIAALLPPKYRGYYAEHPRTKEILHTTV